MTKALIDWLATHPFAWRPDEVEALATATGFKRSEDAAQRTSYSKDGLLLVAYHPDKEIDGIDLEAWNRPAPQSEKAYRREQKALDQEYGKALSELTEASGPPAFEGTLDDAGFPENQDAVRLALWNKPWGRLLLKSQHEGREMPLTVVVTLAR